MFPALYLLLKEEISKGLKSRKFLCHPGLDPGSSLRKPLKILWIHAFAGMTKCLTQG